MVRYTGIHAFHTFGSVKPSTGVNLVDSEWQTLVENFSKIKELLDGQNVNLGDCKRCLDHEGSIKVYLAQWMLNEKVISPNPKEFFTEQEALLHAHERVPVLGRDYPENAGTPEIRVECITKPQPEDIDLMSIIYAYYLNEMIQNEVKENCEACSINSDSQFDHTRNGNCLDETMDFVELYYETAKQKMKVHHLMNVFDTVRSKIGAKPVFSKQLAKGAMAWIQASTFLEQLRRNQDMCLSPLIDVIRKVHDNVLSE